MVEQGSLTEPLVVLASDSTVLDTSGTTEGDALATGTVAEAASIVEVIPSCVVVAGGWA